jgi:hypothetical protein
MAIPGLGRVVMPRDAYAPPGQAVAPGSNAGVFRGRLVIVFGPAGSVVGVFVYAAGTTPGPGNQPIASLTNQTTDPFGNPTVPGSTEYVTVGGQLIAVSATATGSGAGFFFSNLTTALLGNPGMIANILNPAVNGSQLFLTSGQAQAGATAALLEVLDSVAAGGIVNGIINLVAGQNSLQGNANNFMPVNSAGFGGAQWPFNGGQSDSTHTTVISTGFNVCTAQYPLNNDPRPGTIYRLTTWGLGTQGSTQEQMNFRGNITGGAGLGQIQIGALQMPASSVFNFKIIQELQILTTGAAGTWEANIAAIVSAGAGTILSNSGTANSSVAGSRRGNGSINTTAFSLWVEAGWTATTGAPTLTTQGSFLERIGP